MDRGCKHIKCGHLVRTTSLQGPGQRACGFYYFMVKALLGKEENLVGRLQRGIDEARNMVDADLL